MKLIDSPSVIEACGNKPKVIEKFIVRFLNPIKWMKIQEKKMDIVSPDSKRKYMLTKV